MGEFVDTFCSECGNRTKLNVLSVQPVSPLMLGDIQIGWAPKGKQENYVERCKGTKHMGVDPPPESAESCGNCGAQDDQPHAPDCAEPRIQQLQTELEEARSLQLETVASAHKVANQLGQCKRDLAALQGAVERLAENPRCVMTTGNSGNFVVGKLRDRSTKANSVIFPSNHMRPTAHAALLAVFPPDDGIKCSGCGIYFSSAFIGKLVSDKGDPLCPKCAHNDVTILYTGYQKCFDEGKKEQEDNEYYQSNSSSQRPVMPDAQEAP